jgi:inosine-uridine nucleoside N-ribohydrolase
MARPLLPLLGRVSEFASRYALGSKQKVITFCDPGIDDALMLAQTFSSRRLEVLGVVPSAGNVSLDRTVKNTLRICELTGRRDVRVYPGSAAPIGQKTEEMLDGKQVYGEDGLGGVHFPEVTMAAEKKSGSDFAAEAVLAASARDPITLISTGGLTDVYKTLQKVFERNPAALKNIAAISVMGGVFDCAKHANAPLDRAPAERTAEFNMIFDPIATAGVFDLTAKSGIPVFLSPLDLTHTTLFRTDEVEALRDVGNPVASTMAELMAQVPDWYKARFGLYKEKGMQPAHDVNASACLLHPELYTTSDPIAVRSVVEGVDRGKLLTEGARGNVSVLSMPAERIAGFFESFAEDMRSFSLERGTGGGVPSGAVDAESVRALEGRVKREGEKR